MTDDEMREVIVRLDERTGTMAETLDRLVHVVCDGNGQPSLVTQVARQDERLKSVEEGAREMRLTRRQKLKIAVGGGGLLTAATTVGHLILKALGH